MHVRLSASTSWLWVMMLGRCPIPAGRNPIIERPECRPVHGPLTPPPDNRCAPAAHHARRARHQNVLRRKTANRINSLFPGRLHSGSHRVANSRYQRESAVKALLVTPRRTAPTGLPEFLAPLQVAVRVPLSVSRATSVLYSKPFSRHLQVREDAASQVPQ